MDHPIENNITNVEPSLVVSEKLITTSESQISKEDVAKGMEYTMSFIFNHHNVNLILFIFNLTLSLKKQKIIKNYRKFRTIQI